MTPKPVKVVARRGRKPLSDADREPATAFKRLAGSRMLRALKAMRGLEHCANTSQYEYSEKQVEKMIRDLERQVDRVKQAFEHGGPVTIARNNSYFD